MMETIFHSRNINNQTFPNRKTFFCKVTTLADSSLYRKGGTGTMREIAIHGDLIHD